jgi:voltage-gated potassium channel
MAGVRGAGLARARQTQEAPLKRPDPSLLTRAWQTFRVPLFAMVAVHAVGATGFWIIADGKATIVDCVYMVFITVASIGYGEIVDLSQSPGGRVFNMVIATLGIATMGYMLSKLTVFIVEGQFDEVLRRRKMQEKIDHMNGHFIVCGVGRVGTNVAHELALTERPFVAVDESVQAVAAFRERYPEVPVLHGDSSDDEVLERAGVKRAGGVFAVTGDDGKNLIVTLAAKHLNVSVRVVARCHEVRNIEKLKRVGADDIVSPDFTGALRIASSMLRPTVVGFLDEMLRTDGKLRVEEIQISAAGARRALDEVAPASREYVVLAVRAGGGWEFNPPRGFALQPGNALVVMATPEGRRILEQALAL